MKRVSVVPTVVSGMEAYSAGWTYTSDKTPYHKITYKSILTPTFFASRIFK